MPNGELKLYLIKVPITLGIVPNGSHVNPLVVEYSKFAAFVTVSLVSNKVSVKSLALKNNCGTTEAYVLFNRKAALDGTPLVELSFENSQKSEVAALSKIV